jgi:hypothetical protein
LLNRWRDEAVRSGQKISRIAVAFEAGRDGFVHRSSSTVRFTKRLIGNSNQRRGGGLALHFSCWDQAEASRTVGGSATPAARIARLAAGRGADGKALCSC